MKIQVLLHGVLCFSSAVEHVRKASRAIAITWQDIVAEDFSFAQKWSSPEDIYKNKFGQLSCDRICPPETAQMKDEDGKIYEDSLQAFYKLVDTHTFTPQCNPRVLR